MINKLKERLINIFNFAAVVDQNFSEDDIKMQVDKEICGCR